MPPPPLHVSAILFSSREQGWGDDNNNEPIFRRLSSIVFVSTMEGRTTSANATIAVNGGKQLKTTISQIKMVVIMRRTLLIYSHGNKDCL